MSTKNLITENEAVNLAGVSARTLLRFSESGYLTVETDTTGIRWFSRAQLEEIFGITATLCGETASTVEERVSEAPCSPEETNLLQDDGSKEQARETAHAAIERDTVSDVPSDNDDSRTPRANDSVPSLELEIQRLHNLLSIQERILDSKDDEIADLKNQRSWLRERIEKLEEKSDRDQILLLSETQTIRRLISLQENRKSPVKQLLEWIGLARANDVATLAAPSDFPQTTGTGSGSRTIEVRRAANNQ